ncbi:hypothetical protein GCM10027294_30070 [Marinactinospora endophytica]
MTPSNVSPVVFVTFPVTVTVLFFPTARGVISSTISGAVAAESPEAGDTVLATAADASWTGWNAVGTSATAVAMTAPR